MSDQRQRPSNQNGSGKSQVSRFREAARELGADVPEEEFDRALKRVAKVGGEEARSKQKDAKASSRRKR